MNDGIGMADAIADVLDQEGGHEGINLMFALMERNARDAAWTQEQIEKDRARTISRLTDENERLRQIIATMEANVLGMLYRGVKW